MNEKWNAGPRRRWYHRPKAIAIGVVVGVLAASSVAFALWMASGSGSVATHTGTLTALVVVAPTNPGGALLPGGTASATADISNSNGTPVQLASLTQTGVATSPDSGCNAAIVAGDFTFTSSGLPLTVPPAGLTGQAVGSVTAASSISNACQNVAIVIPVSTSTTVGT